MRISVMRELSNERLVQLILNKDVLAGMAAKELNLRLCLN